MTDVIVLGRMQHGYLVDHFEVGPARSGKNGVVFSSGLVLPRDAEIISPADRGGLRLRLERGEGGPRWEWAQSPAQSFGSVLTAPWGPPKGSSGSRYR